MPMFHISSWYDIFLEGALTAFSEISERAATSLAKENQKLLVGPWAHIRPFTEPNTGGCGDIDFGEAAAIELHEHLRRWFDHWLKDEDTGYLDEPSVNIFVMGENQWRQEDEWPLARTHYTKFYLHGDTPANSKNGGGYLSTVPPDDDKPDEYIYDPENPVPTKGGNTLIIPFGVANQSETEARDDVLVYSTPPLEKDTEITGPIKMHLFAATSAIDTDFTAKLVDVHPDGYSQNLQDGIVRARFRTSVAQPSFVEPGRVYPYVIDLWSTSHLVKKGHQIRVDISSSNFPRFDRNPNTGATLGVDSKLEKAKQTVYHNSTYPSHIVLSLIHI